MKLTSGAVEVSKVEDISSAAKRATTSADRKLALLKGSRSSDSGSGESGDDGEELHFDGLIGGLAKSCCKSGSLVGSRGDVVSWNVVVMFFLCDKVGPLYTSLWYQPDSYRKGYESFQGKPSPAAFPWHRHRSTSMFRHTSSSQWIWTR